MLTTKLSRRAFLSSATLAALGAALAACAPKATPAPTTAPKAAATTAPVAGQPTVAPAKPTTAPTAVPTAAPAKKQKVTVRWQGGGGAVNQPFTEKIVAENFAPEHPEINVVIEPKPDGWDQLLLTQMIAGTAPDILETWGNIFWQWGDRGLLLDLNPFVDRDMTKEQIADFTEYQWNGLDYKGVRVGMPRYINLIVFFFNVALFRKYNVEPPPISGDYDMDDYTEMMKKLTEAARKDGKTNMWAGWVPMWNGDRFWGPIRSFGGNVVDKKYGKTCVLDKPEGMEALQYMYDMQYKWNYHAQPVQVENKWPSASFGPQLIMSCQEGVGGAYMRREVVWYEEAKIVFDMRHVPKGPRGERHSLGTTDCWNIWSGSKVKEEAWTFLKWAVGPVYQLKYNVQVAGAIPVLKSVQKQWVSEVRRIKPRQEFVRLETVTEAFEWGYPEDQPQFCNSLEAYNVLIPALEKVYTVGDVGPEYIASKIPEINKTQEGCTV